VSSLLLDMLEMKELRGRPDGVVGKAVNLINVKQVYFLVLQFYGNMPLKK
jgi:hypothetical protein